MSRTAHIALHPAGTRIEAEIGSPLSDALFGYGVEFPCGGRGQCRGCRIKVLRGSLPPTAQEQQLLSAEEIENGWRLACQGRVAGDLVIELAQWDVQILADERPFAFEPRDGLGVAVDVGTTTLAAQLLDLRTGQVLASRTALNPQARHGADIASRIYHATEHAAQPQLEREIRHKIGRMIGALLHAASSPAGELDQITLVGNTAMHHLFCGIDAAPLAAVPFEPEDASEHVFTAAELDWPLAAQTTIRFLPCIGGFVGSDVLAGIIASELDAQDRLAGLVDLGTNGEIVLGTRRGLLCASTAAGPAFEGARIAAGMRASSGAISRCAVRGGQLACDVIGGGPAHGLCGSGLVDAVGCGLDLGLIASSGRFTGGLKRMALAGEVALLQADIRQLQLAKAAIAAGIRMLLARLGKAPANVESLFLAGAFGNYVSRESARRIGLLRVPFETIRSVGNTALLGAKMALYPEGDSRLRKALARTRHIALGDEPAFQDIFVEEMAFPQAATHIPSTDQNTCIQ